MSSEGLKKLRLAWHASNSLDRPLMLNLHSTKTMHDQGGDPGVSAILNFSCTHYNSPFLAVRPTPATHVSFCPLMIERHVQASSSVVLVRTVVQTMCLLPCYCSNLKES